MINDDNYIVQNLGLGGRTMMKTGDAPYWNEQYYQDALNSEADIIILMLGTNDSKYYQWNQTEYVKDFLEMATNFKNLDSNPDLYVMIPPPLYEEGAIQANQTVINEIFPELIPNLAKNLSLGDDKVIDIFSAMGGAGLDHYELFCDGQNCDPCHPNDAGYTFMASQIYKKIFNPTPPKLDDQEFI